MLSSQVCNLTKDGLAESDFRILRMPAMLTTCACGRCPHNHKSGALAKPLAVDLT